MLHVLGAEGHFGAHRPAQHDKLPVNQQAFTAISRRPTPQEKVLLEQFTLSTPMPSDSAMSIAWQAMEVGELDQECIVTPGVVVHKIVVAEGK